VWHGGPGRNFKEATPCHTHIETYHNILSLAPVFGPVPERLWLGGGGARRRERRQEGCWEGGGGEKPRGKKGAIAK
jgi:hypothetical protein